MPSPKNEILGFCPVHKASDSLPALCRFAPDPVQSELLLQTNRVTIRNRREPKDLVTREGGPSQAQMQSGLQGADVQVSPALIQSVSVISSKAWQASVCLAFIS